MGRIGLGWVDPKTDNGLEMNNYSTYMYTINDDDDDLNENDHQLTTVFRPIEKRDLL